MFLLFGTRPSIQLLRQQYLKLLTSELLNFRKYCKYERGKTDLAIKKLIVGAIEDKIENGDNKITVIGAGRVGSICAYTLAIQGVTNDICIIDQRKDVLRAQYYDLLHASASVGNIKIVATTDYAATEGSRIVIITAGAPIVPTDRLQLLDSSIEILRGMIPQIVKYSPNTILYIISNPCDILAYVAWKLSGLPKHKIIGSGTEVDSCRLRAHIATRLNVGVSNCRGWMLGEHGESMAAMWSTVCIGGVRLIDLNPKAGAPDDPDKWEDVAKDVRGIGFEIYKGKGDTAWAVSTVTTKVARSILTNKNEIYAVSTYANGFYGIDGDIFLSLPVTLGSNGITSIIKLILPEDEMKSLHSSAAKIAEYEHRYKT